MFQPSQRTQPAGEIFVARITQVGSAEGEFGTGSGFVPHGWQEQMLEAGGRGYQDDPIGHNGSPGLNPAFDLNGNTVPVGTKVFLRARGVNGLDNGVVYDIVGFYGTTVCVPVVTGIQCVNGNLVMTTQYLRVIGTLNNTPC